MGQARVQTEVELKFSIGDPHKIRERLLELGFSTSGQVFEHNLVLDTPDGELSAAGQLLRLRRDRIIRLTFKERSGSDPSIDERYKVRAESELELMDLETMRHILHKLGYTEERVYEKRREHFARENGVHAELDTLPYLGNFLELEAPPEMIDSLAGQLGLDLAEGLRENYFQLFNRFREENGIQNRDIRFSEAEQWTAGNAQQ